MVLNIKNIIDLTVPHFLLIVFFAPISSFMIIYNELPGVEIIPIIISLSFSVLGFNTFNMIYDFKLDKIEKPLRPLPSGRVSILEARFLAILFYSFSFLLAFLVNIYFVLLIILFILTSFSYSFPKVNLKKYFWGSSIVGTILYGIIPFLSVYSLGLVSIPWFFMFLFSAFFFIVSNTKDFEDVDGEKKYGINSFPLKFGWENSKNLIMYSLGGLIIMTSFFSLIEFIDFSYIYASGISFVIFLVMVKIFTANLRKLQYKHIIFKELKDSKVKDIIFQSDAVTINVSMVLLIELVYGFVSLA